MSTETKVRTPARLHHSDTSLHHISTAHEVHGPEARRYFRGWARNEVNLPAKVEVKLATGRKFTNGTAVIRDISLKGALLGKLQLKKPYLPVEPFRIVLSFRREQEIGALCRPVRFGTGPHFELAVAFEDIWAVEQGDGRESSRRKSR